MVVHAYNSSYSGERGRRIDFKASPGKDGKTATSEATTKRLAV
jgi:hypothetical protein